jgi:hypothetical protein
MQRTGGFSEVQVAADSLLDKAELMQIHMKLKLIIDFIMHLMR